MLEVVVVHFSHSMACLLEKKKVAVIFVGKIQEHDSEICPNYEVCWKCSERCELICASHWGVRNLNLSVLMVVFVSSET